MLNKVAQSSHRAEFYMQWGPIQFNLSRKVITGRAHTPTQKTQYGDNVLRVCYPV